MHALVRRAVLLCAVGGALLGGAVPSHAHEERRVGPLVTVVGWEEEPAYAGFRNGVSFSVSRGGEPVTGGRLRVEVIFGNRDGEQRTEPLPLDPSFGAAGEYHASLIPTRPGTYTFHITGRVGGARIDQFFTSGDDTFDDARAPTESQFPAKDPSNADLAALSERLESRLTAAANDASDDASLARILGIAGIGLGAIALALSLFRRPRSG